jgi:hypothetical protein
LNSLYLNLKNREGQGSVAADQVLGLLDKLQTELQDWRGPDGRPVIQRVLQRGEAFNGPFTPYGPDLFIGYSPGYRASSETGLGQWSETAIEANNDHWGADHCIDSQAVPGVIFRNRGLGDTPQPSYRDFPVLAIGKELEQPQSEAPPPPPTTGEDSEVLEKRLKDLGYL